MVKATAALKRILAVRKWLPRVEMNDDATKALALEQMYADRRRELFNELGRARRLSEQETIRARMDGVRDATHAELETIVRRASGRGGFANSAADLLTLAIVAYSRPDAGAITPIIMTILAAGAVLPHPQHGFVLRPVRS